ncbi:GGDEF domain-containing protein [Cereibacter sphaeroides]|uniref:GGDEF domain-containing protein n=1 Tax=Cereibacter sphaeroides TaxID=1063 RepID=UPI000F528E41|nr:diguanylate cyclase [Cereibacter sphaeroides]AZB64570.1 GGDEF domain-containing protein [Cereibacter sphaeroides]AZB67496.1 GGDEF domain-containing protein [Cereibacter sphaeroides]
MPVFLHIIDSCALMAGIALIFSYIQRNLTSRLIRSIASGFLFGLGAMISIHEPFVVATGVRFDARSLFIGFAGAFAGPVGAVAALAVGAATRLLIDFTQSAMIGVLSMAGAAAAGLIWSTRRDFKNMQPWKSHLLLGLMISISLILIVFAPLPGDDPPSVALIIASLTLNNVAGSMLLGGILVQEKRRAERERAAQKNAETDPLTGLLNRRAFDKIFSMAAATPGSPGTGLLLVDIDHFKKINDTHGHPVGDRALQALAALLTRSVRDRDCVVRFGGEEFAIVLPGVREEDVCAMADRLCASLRTFLDLGDQRLYITASVGGAHAELGKISLSELLERADESLYLAKTNGRDRAVCLPQR